MRRGRTAKFTILTAKGHTVRERTLAVIKEQLRRVGVGLDVDVAAVERGSMIEAWSEGDYDAIYFAIESDSIDPARNRSSG
jgi:ABC-type transport system substrate-binding protein